MPPKVARRRRTRPVGKGKLGDILRKAHTFVKSQKLISTHLPKLMAMHKVTAPYAAQVGSLAATAGYGRRRRVRSAPARRVTGGRRRRVRAPHGGSIGSWLKGAASKVGRYLQDSKILSRSAPTVLGMVPGFSPALAGVITKGLQVAGLGMRRRRVRQLYGRGVPIGLPAGVPQGTSQPYYPIATSRAVARF